MTPRLATVSVTLFLLVPVPAMAYEYALGASYGARYSDNVRRVAEDPVSDVEHNLIGNGRILLQTPRLNLEATGAVELEYYADESFDSRSIETLNGNALYIFVPNRLTWMATDTLSDSRIDPLSPGTSNNLEQTNLFSTGPDLILQPSVRNTFRMLARYENDTYQVSDILSNERGVGEMSWNYRLSEPARILVRYRYESVHFQGDLAGEDFVRDTLTAGFEGRLNPTIQYRLEAGPTRIRRDLVEETIGTAGIAQLIRQITQDSGVSITVSSALSDSGRVVQGDPTLSPVLQILGVNPGQVDIVKVRAGNVDYFSTLGFFNYRLNATVREEDFETSNRDVLAAGGGAVGEYEFGPRLIGFASGSFTRSDYRILLRVDDDTVGSAGLRFLFRRRWSAALAISHDNRDSTSALQSFEENSIAASIAYRYETPLLSTKN